jgi:hypothetical protein
MPSIFIRQTHLLVREDVILYKDYYRRSSVEKKSLVGGLRGLDAKKN